MVRLTDLPEWERDHSPRESVAGRMFLKSQSTCGASAELFSDGTLVPSAVRHTLGV